MKQSIWIATARCAHLAMTNVCSAPSSVHPSCSFNFSTSALSCFVSRLPIR